MAEKKLSFISSIGGKILTIFVIVSILAISALTAVFIIQASNGLRQKAYDQLASINAIKKAQIADYIDTMKNQLSIVKDDPFMEEALIEFDEAYEKTGTIKSREWEAVNAKYDARLKDIRNDFGWSDFFLICLDGDILYTAARGSDLGLNLKGAQLVTSALGKAFNQIKQITDSEQVVIADFETYAPAGGKPAAFMIARLDGIDDKLAGYVAFEIPLDMINVIMHEREGMGETGETFLVGPDKRMRSDSFMDKTGSHSVEASFRGTIEKNGIDSEAVREGLEGRAGQKIMRDYNGNMVLVDWEPVDLGSFLWVLEAKINVVEIDKPVNALIFFILLIAIAIIGVVVLVTVLFSRTISRPLLTVVREGERITRGDFPEKDIKVRSKDEVGIIVDVFNRIVHSLKEKGEELEAIANGDLSIKVKYASEKDQFAGSFEKMVKSLNEVLGQVNSAVEQVASGSGQVSQSSQALSQGASEQASSLEEISSSINEIAGQSRRNAENAVQANSLARQATENAEAGNRQMKELVSSMQKINVSSDEIKKVVKVIDDIAFQINLLALNANVEAARAGKYGKGFAVVAEEVRNLAVKSAASVKETTAMVEDSIKNIGLGNQAAEITAKQLEEIVSGASRVADLVEEIASASKEQAQGVEQINTGLEQVNQVTQSNTANAEESASAAEELSSRSQQLKAMIARFKLAEMEITEFSCGMVDQELLHKLVQEELKRQYAAAQKRTAVNATVAGERGVKETADSLQKTHTTGVKPYLNPKEVIRLDDDDFGNF